MNTCSNIETSYSYQVKDFKSKKKQLIYYLFFFFIIFLIVGDDVYQSKKPLNTVINPNNENTLKTMVLKLSRP